MSDFIGDEFQAVVSSLVDHARQIKAGKNVPRFVLLEAESGAGKSRIVREVYEAIRNDPELQPLDSNGVGYWPPLRDDTYVADGAFSGFRERKVLGPDPVDFKFQGTQLPGFLWMPVRCDVLAGTTGTSAIDLMLPHLRRHTPFVALSWRKAANPKENLENWFAEHFKEELDVFLDNASVEVVLKLFEVFLEVSFPMLAYGIDKVFAAGKGVARKIKNTTRSRELEAGFEKDADQTFKQLIRMVHKNVPLVLVLEDAHLIDEPTAQLVRLLVTSGRDKPVMILATAWPESRGRSTFERLIRDLETGNQVLAYGQDQESPFPELSISDRLQLVRTFGPATVNEKAKLIADIWRNPLALRLTLGGDRIQRSIVDGAITISDEEIRRLPRDVKRIYEERWLELDTELKEVLMLVSGSIPKQRHVDGIVSPVIAKILTDAVIISGLAKADSAKFEELISIAISPVKWIVKNDAIEEEIQFREVALQLVARQEFEEYFTASEVDGFRNILVGVIADWILQKGEPWFDEYEATEVQVTQWLLELVAAIETRKNVLEATSIAALTLANFQAHNGKYDRCLALIEGHAVLAITDPFSLYKIEALRASCLARTGKTKEAIRCYELAQVKLDGLGHPLADFLERKLDLVSAQSRILAEEGKYDEALAPVFIYLDLLNKESTTLDDPEDYDIRAFDLLADLYEYAGDFNKALEFASQSANLAARIDSEAAYSKVMPKITYAKMLHYVGDVDGAIQVLSELVNKFQNDTDAIDSDLWMQLLVSAGEVYFDWGDRDSAGELLKTAYEVAKEKGILNTSLGRQIRMYLAWLKSSDEEVPEQIDILEGILDEEKIIYGADHPALIAVLGNLANAYSLLPGGKVKAHRLALELVAITERWRSVGHPQWVHAKHSELAFRPNISVSNQTALEYLALYEAAVLNSGPIGVMTQGCLRAAISEFIQLAEFTKALELIEMGLSELRAHSQHHNRFSWQLMYLQVELLKKQGKFTEAEEILDTLLREAEEAEHELSDAFQEAVMEKAALRQLTGADMSKEAFPELHRALKTWADSFPVDAIEWAESIGLELSIDSDERASQMSVHIRKMGLPQEGPLPPEVE